MNILGKIPIKYAEVTTILMLFIVMLILPVELFSSELFDSWGISRDAVFKKYISPGITINEFTPFKNPDYENKIMNMVKFILKNVDADAEKDIIVISVTTNPSKDFLLFKNKLFSVKESYNIIPKEELSKVVKKLSEQYGQPNYNLDNDMEIYFISNKNTKIIVHYYIKSRKCEIYFYDSLLYRKLSSNEF